MESKNWQNNAKTHVEAKNCILMRQRRRFWIKYAGGGGRKMEKYAPPPLTPTNLATLRCLGLWRQRYKLRDGNQYQISLTPPLGNPHLYFISRRRFETTQGMVTFAVHHVNCSGLAHDQKYQPLSGKTCYICRSLFQNPKFVKILKGANDPSRMKLGTKVNNRYLSHAHLCHLKQQWTLRDASKRWNTHNQKRNVLRLKRRAEKSIEKLPKSKTIINFLKHVDIINDHGTTDMKNQALQFVYRLTAGIASQARVKAGKIKRTCMKDWGPILPIFTALRAMSLPRVERLMTASLGGCGPPPSTVGDAFRKLREKNFPCGGLDVESRMRRAIPILRNGINALGLQNGDKIPFQLGCDATPIPQAPEYDEAMDIVTNICGPIGHDKCTLDPPQKIGDGVEGYYNIVKMVLESEWSSYIYIGILQPLVDHIPNQCVLVYPTCNRFDHKPHLEYFWNRIYAAFHQILVVEAKLPVMLVGKGADGDSRERCLSLQRMYLRYRSEVHPRRSTFSKTTRDFLAWYGLPGATGWRLYGEKTSLCVHDNVCEVVTAIDSSDPNHCDKKMDKKGQDKKNTHIIGGYDVLHSHLLLIMRMEKTSTAMRNAMAGLGASTGVYRSDLEEQDPQNLAACTRRCGFMMLRALIALQPAGARCMRGVNPKTINPECLPDANTDPATIPVMEAVLKGTHDMQWVGTTLPNLPELQTQGTVAFYAVAAASTLMHNSKSWGILQRVRFASFVNTFLAVWRQRVIHTAGLTLSQNFLTSETYSDLVQNLHETVLTIMTFRDFCPGQPVGLHHSGSNCCEDEFSFAGGHSYVAGIREYSHKGFLRMDERKQALSLLHIRGVRRGRIQHRKQEWPAKYHEKALRKNDFRILMRQHPTDDALRKTWEAGSDDGKTLATFLGWCTCMHIMHSLAHTHVPFF